MGLQIRVKGYYINPVRRHPNDDLHMHINNFLQICDTLKINGVGDNAIQVRLFPFSSHDNGKLWLNYLPSGSVMQWDDVAQKFLAKYFSLVKMTYLRNKITILHCLMVNHCMRHRKNIRSYDINAYIMVCRGGYKFKHFRID